ncbi:MAPEG family protein [Pseudomonadota bacterium]|jgi:glutathione S-transferase
MDHATLIVLLALLQYVWFTGRVGAARGKYHVNAPACDGDESWNRLFRVQQNTMEQLIVFVPATYAFAIYLSELWVLVPGLAFMIGRFLYSAEYLKDPKTRTPGMAITLLANVVLVLGALFGLVKVMFFS